MRLIRFPIVVLVVAFLSACSDSKENNAASTGQLPPSLQTKETQFESGLLGYWINQDENTKPLVLHFNGKQMTVYQNIEDDNDHLKIIHTFRYDLMTEEDPTCDCTILHTTNENAENSKIRLSFMDARRMTIGFEDNENEEGLLLAGALIPSESAQFSFLGRETNRLKVRGLVLPDE